MKRFTIALAALAVMVGLSGCAQKMQRYSVSSDNVQVLRGLLAHSQSVGIGTFTDSSNSGNALTCRLSTPMETPNGESFADYIKNAFRKELIVSGMFSHDPKTIISANLNSVKSSTTLGDAYWEFDITVKSSNGKSFRVRSRYEYSSSFSADAACYKMRTTLPIAVRKLINDIIMDPRFVTLLKKK